MKRDRLKTMRELGRNGLYGPRFMRHWAAQKWRDAREGPIRLDDRFPFPKPDSPVNLPFRGIESVLRYQMAANILHNYSGLSESTMKDMGYPGWDLTNCMWHEDAFSRWGYQF